MTPSERTLLDIRDLLEKVFRQPGTPQSPEGSPPGTHQTPGTPDRWGATERLLGVAGQKVPFLGEIAAMMRFVRELADAIKDFQKAWESAVGRPTVSDLAGAARVASWAFDPPPRRPTGATEEPPRPGPSVIVTGATANRPDRPPAPLLPLRPPPLPAPPSPAGGLPPLLPGPTPGLPSVELSPPGLAAAVPLPPPAAAGPLPAQVDLVRDADADVTAAVEKLCAAVEKLLQGLPDMTPAQRRELEAHPVVRQAQKVVEAADAGHAGPSAQDALEWARTLQHLAALA